MVTVGPERCPIRSSWYRRVSESERSAQAMPRSRQVEPDRARVLIDLRSVHEALFAEPGGGIGEVERYKRCCQPYAVLEIFEHQLPEHHPVDVCGVGSVKPRHHSITTGRPALALVRSLHPEPLKEVVTLWCQHGGHGLDAADA